MVTTFRISENRQCPSCLENGEKEPGEFNAGKCRLRQSYLNSSSESTVTCTTCLAAGRLGKVAICDVSPAEVYISGFDTLPADFQAAISKWIRALEIEADVCCCKSEPGMCPMKGVQQDAKLQDALIVLVLFSDAYFGSSQCMEELIVASSMKKCIIPVVLSSLMKSSVPHTYWTDVERNAFLQVVKVACEGLDTGELRVELSLIQNNGPCVLLDSDFYYTGEVAMRVASKIQSHIQRPGKLDIYADFSMLGIKLSFFDRFIHDNGGRDKFEKLTTLQVMETFIKPKTKESKLSFCELLESQGSDYVGRAEWFYSHAWKYRFLDAVDAAKLFFEKKRNYLKFKDPTIWFDIFSVSQHKAEIRPFEWWNSAFLNAVGSIGKVLMLMQPFDDKETDSCAWFTLTRVWCVFELFACESTMSEFEVTMTEPMSDRFLKALQRSDEQLLKSLATIKCEDSKAFKEEDQKRVFEVINRTIGFPLLNSLVLWVMERWIFSQLFHEMRTKSETDYLWLKTMTKFCEECKTRREKTLLKVHPDTIRSKYLLDCITKALHNQQYLQTLISRDDRLFTDAEEMMREELKTAQKLGEDSNVLGQETTK